MPYKDIIKQKEYRKKYHKLWYEKNKQQRILQIKQYENNNKEKAKVWAKKSRDTYYSKNTDKIKKDIEKLTRWGQTPKGKFSAYKRSAKRKNQEFLLTFDEFLSFWAKKCFYCNTEIRTIGIDRIDNTKGYEISNCVPCCTYCNILKSASSQEEFLGHIKKIYLNITRQSSGSG